MNWILVIIIVYTGGNVTIGKVPMESEILCKEAVRKMQNHDLSMQYYRGHGRTHSAKPVCLQAKKNT